MVPNPQLEANTRVAVQCAAWRTSNLFRIAELVLTDLSTDTKRLHNRCVFGVEEAAATHLGRDEDFWVSSSHSVCCVVVPP